MSRLRQLLRNTPFIHQLTLTMAMAVLSLALVTSIAISWQGTRVISTNLIEQGRQVAENLARQSKLALIYDSSENAAEVAKMTLTFPDVIGLEIRRADGRLLLGKNSKNAPMPSQQENTPTLGQDAYLESDLEDSWHFVAPVLAGDTNESPFNVAEPSKEVLGYVRVTKSKATLSRMRTEVVAVNFAVSFLVAFIFLVIVRILTIQMTRPLTRLSEVMAQAEEGTSGVRADPAGPKDIMDMATAFNKMMTVLEDRETELRTARDNALKFAKLKADFAATVSHEIRTPLNGVVGTLDILMAADIPPKQRQFVEIAWDSSQYLLDLINNILDFSKLEAGKVELERTDFNVGHMVENILELLTPQAMQKGLDIGYLLAPDVPVWLKGDPRRLRQVLVNLIGNAVKFTESGSVDVKVSIEKVEECDFQIAMGSTNELNIRFEVIDTGIGIGETAHENIFDSFTQEDTSTTRRFGGSGLGLAICKQLVGLMGGAIGVESVQGLGSCFWFSVPLTPLTKDSAQTHQRPYWPGLRALVADESEIVRRFLQQALTSWGFQCDIATDAGSTLAKLREAESSGKDYRIVIIDTLFSTNDGCSLPEKIRSDFGDHPCLILMNRYGAEHVPAAIQADAYISKPLRLERLLEAISGAIGGNAEAPEIAVPAPLPLPAQTDHRILVVEDNRTNQTIAQGLLAVLGCNVEIAENGQQGLLAFKRQPWDLIFMDCSMPDMDGYQVTAAIRFMEQSSGRRTPIVAMTANVQTTDIEKCLAAGMDDHLPKPLMLENVSAKLRRWIENYQAIAQREEAPRLALAEKTGRDAEPIDSVSLTKLREALGSAIGQAIKPFLEDMPVYLEAMDQAISAGNAEALVRSSHAIKGAAGNLGAVNLATVAGEIEELAKTDQFDSASKLVSHARAEYSLVQQALLTELKSEALPPQGDMSKGALVLVVDDDRSTRAALRYALQRSGFSVEEAIDGIRALAMLDRIIPDVILMDAMMPMMDGFAACAKLQEHPRGKDIPVLMITALEDNLSIERAFAAGASDYISKPINLAVVNQRIKRVVEAQRAEKHVRHLAFNDTITGLPNRVLFADHLSLAIERAKTSNQSLAVLFLDLDRFKFVNDTLGHEIGDRLLKAVAGRIRNCVRTSDCVARLGGDEFTVLLDELDNKASATNAAQKIRRSLTSAFEIDGQDIFVSTSIGISVFPEDGHDVSTLLRHADAAMYRAKRANGGVEFYESGMEATVSRHLHMDSALRRALERNELEVFYQPKADAKSGQITGMEALVRWNHPERGMISPLEFIPLAEETGIIIPIGEWVLRTACAQTREWQNAGIPDLNIAVNLSGSQLKEGELYKTVSSVLQETGLDPQYLTLEIT